MNNILRYIAVLLVFSWVTPANAGPIAVTVIDSTGTLRVDGFDDFDGSFITFLFTYAPGTSANIIQPIVAGRYYDIATSNNIPGIGTFTTNFSLFGEQNVAPGSIPLVTLFPTLTPNPINGFLSQLILDDSLLDIFFAGFGVNGSNAMLLLYTKVISGTKLITDLKALDGSISPPANGRVISAFNQGNITIESLPITAVPEPTTLLLLGSGLLGMFGYSKKRV